MERRTELFHLAEADQHIALAERNVEKQRLQVEKLRGHGHDVGLAEQSLNGLEAALVTMQKHRAMIIKIIEQIDQGLI